MVKTYGRTVISELDGLRLSLKKVTNQDLGEMYQKYKSLV